MEDWRKIGIWIQKVKEIENTTLGRPRIRSINKRTTLKQKKIKRRYNLVKIKTWRQNDFECKKEENNI